jgi:osmotically-inducible protein OsmY
MRANTHTMNHSDAEIFTAARHALDDNPAVPSGVRVHVSAGVVTLTGSVRLPGDRMEAEETIRHIRGVRRIVDEIYVQSVDAAGF